MSICLSRFSYTFASPRRIFLEQNRVLIISHDVVGEQMAGPGIRYHHLSRVLSSDFDVVLAIPKDSTSSINQDYTILKYQDRYDDLLIAAINDAEVVLVPAIWVNELEDALSSSYIVIDGYDPFVVEMLALGNRNIDSVLQTLTKAVLLGDFFVCASERQRDWWLGILEFNGRVNPHTFGEDASLRTLIDVVPYGLPKTVPQGSDPVVKGVWSGINPKDKVILWGGGLWPWLDPLTAIRAMVKVCNHRRDVRLIFPGTRHPNPHMRGIPTHNEAAYQLAKEKDLLEKAVFFGEWVPYEDWAEVLLESDIALTLHYDTLETRLAFRSRLLDYIWAGLPTVATKGDATSEIIREHRLGVTVDFEDVDGVAQAIIQLLDTSSEILDARFRSVREILTWERSAQPLIDFCRHPHQAADKMALGESLGNPFYLAKQRQIAEQSKHWRELVHQYERGYFIRFMRWLDRMRRRVLGCS
jgi:hypothetical protein